MVFGWNLEKLMASHETIPRLKKCHGYRREHYFRFGTSRKNKCVKLIDCFFAKVIT